MDEMDHSVGFLESSDGQVWEREVVSEWMSGAREAGLTQPDEFMRHGQARTIAKWADENDQLHGMTPMDAEALISFYIGFGTGVHNGTLDPSWRL